MSGIRDYIGRLRSVLRSVMGDVELTESDSAPAGAGIQLGEIRPSTARSTTSKRKIACGWTARSPLTAGST